MARSQRAHPPSHPQALMRLHVTESAERDLLANAFYYETQRDGLGEYFAARMFAEIESLQKYAGIRASDRYGNRRLLTKVFPFAVFYRMTGDLVTIVGVFDCRRDPKATARRLQSRLKSSGG